MTDLIAAARSVRDRAYAPYSGYPVGAAIRDAQGRLWTGCNVENVAYPSGMCAERNAVGSMVAGGVREIAEVAIATKDGGTPCGACLQVLREFSPDPSKVQVRCIDEAGLVRSYPLSELMPHGFDSPSVSRTER